MSVRILVGDCVKKLQELPDQSVHCCVTSPPYWQLRKYKGESDMIGQEATFEQHLGNLMAVFDEVWRVLRDDGVFYLNYGDAYTGSGRGSSLQLDRKPGAINKGNLGSLEVDAAPKGALGLPPKNLMFMPFRIALALQDRGWIARSRIPWLKSNPTPESVKDRPVSAHEEVFMFSKSHKTLFWTHPSKSGTRTKPKPEHYWFNRKTHEISEVAPERWKELKDAEGTRIWVRRNWWEGNDYYWDHVAVRTPVKGADSEQPLSAYKSDGVGRRSETGDLDGGHRSKWPGIGRQHARERDRNEKQEPMRVNEGANMRNYIIASTASFKGAHFAVYPVGLIEPLIRAGTSENCCSQCGAPLARQTEVELKRTAKGVRKNVVDVRDFVADPNDQGSNRQKDGHLPGWYNHYTTKGWAPTCECLAYTVPCTVLDPFAGAGTTGLVADRLGRDAILIEISAEYALLAAARIDNDAPLFTTVTTE